ncbi:hypothetical protein HY993_00970 [Candidatus Micrarchaeota archaeon]|nr:hypothetical protein [Candidatus Micrarchaeota archaeon]
MKTSFLLAAFVLFALVMQVSAESPVLKVDKAIVKDCKAKEIPGGIQGCIYLAPKEGTGAQVKLPVSVFLFNSNGGKFDTSFTESMDLDKNHFGGKTISYSITGLEKNKKYTIQLTDGSGEAGTADYAFTGETLFEKADFVEKVVYAYPTSRSIDTEKTLGAVYSLVLDSSLETATQNHFNEYLALELAIQQENGEYSSFRNVGDYSQDSLLYRLTQSFFFPDKLYHRVIGTKNIAPFTFGFRARLKVIKEDGLKIGGKTYAKGAEVGFATFSKEDAFDYKLCIGGNAVANYFDLGGNSLGNYVNERHFYKCTSSLSMLDFGQDLVFSVKRGNVGRTCEDGGTTPMSTMAKLSSLSKVDCAKILFKDGRQLELNAPKSSSSELAKNKKSSSPQLWSATDSDGRKYSLDLYGQKITDYGTVKDNDVGVFIQVSSSGKTSSSAKNSGKVV